MEYKSAVYLDKENSEKIWLEFNANSTYLLGEFIGDFNLAVAVTLGYDESDLDFQVAENIRKNIGTHHLPDFFDKYALDMLRRLKTLDRSYYDIFQWVKSEPLTDK